MGDHPIPEGQARGYSWPPFEPGNSVGVQFEPGNLAAKTHGAFSDRLVNPLAQQILAEVAPLVTWWVPADMPTAAAWARTEARVQLVSEWLGDHGGDLYAAQVPVGSKGDTITVEGEVRSASLLLNRLEARAESLRSKLGLDPLSRARLGRDVAAGQVDLARLMADEQERRRREQEGGDDDDR